MASKFLKYTFGAIFVYLLVSNATNSGVLLTQGGGQAVSFAKTLQGR